MWTPEKHKKSMEKEVSKVIRDFKKDGIELSLEDPNPKLNNIIFYGHGSTCKMSHHSFYRYSGTGRKVIGSGDNERIVVLTINDWLQIIIRSIVNNRLQKQQNDK
jgi:hypothetical protein